MNAITDLALRFPLIVFTVLLALLGVYWLLVLLRLVPTELFERDSLKEDHLASTMVSLGFAGVPVSVALTILTLLAGAVTLVVELLVLSWVPLGFFRVPVGVVVLWLSFALASPVTAGVCRRLHCRLHRHPGLSRRCLLGERVQVTSVAENGRASAVMDDDEAREVQLLGKTDNQPRRAKPGSWSSIYRISMLTVRCSKRTIWMPALGWCGCTWSVITRRPKGKDMATMARRRQPE